MTENATDCGVNCVDTNYIGYLPEIFVKREENRILSDDIADKTQVKSVETNCEGCNNNNPSPLGRVQFSVYQRPYSISSPDRKRGRSSIIENLKTKKHFRKGKSVATCNTE